MIHRILLLFLLLVACAPAQAGVGLHAGTEMFEVGTGSFFHAFFSTASANLESKGWGSRFPVLMKQLYQGTVAPSSLNALEAELRSAQSELKKLPPPKVVWDIENPSARPPWGENISPHITDLSNYFVTSDGQDMFTVLFRAIESAKKQNVPLSVE